MMTWPWVSRRAYELVLKDNEWLRTRYEDLLDQFTRVRRKEAGMVEAPPGQRPPVVDDIPPEVMDYIRGWDSEAMQQATLDDVLRARRAGTKWPEIIAILQHEADAQ